MTPPTASLLSSFIHSSFSTWPLLLLSAALLLLASPLSAQWVDGDTLTAFSQLRSSDDASSFFALEDASFLAFSSPVELLSSLQVVTSMGPCRGFSLPGSLRYCVHPGCDLDATLTVEGLQIANLPPSAALLEALASAQTTVVVVDDDPQLSPFLSSLQLEPSTLLPVYTPFSPSAAAAPVHLPAFVFNFRGLLQVVSTEMGIFNLSAQLPLPPSLGLQVRAPPVVSVEVTCSDGVFCNGAERWMGGLNGSCMAGIEPCDDGDDCTADSCDEAFGTCQHRLTTSAPGCQDAGYCGGPHCLPQCPAGSECGPDGCGGSCGSLECAAGSACRAFLCIAADYPYSCQRPAPLVAEGRQLLGEHRLLLDLAAIQTADEVSPACTAYGNGDDLALHFTVPDSFSRGVGVDAWLKGDVNQDVDTVMEIRRDRCSDSHRLSTSAPPPTPTEQGDDYVCSDNSEPPGQHRCCPALAAPLEGCCRRGC